MKDRGQQSVNSLTFLLVVTANIGPLVLDEEVLIAKHLTGAFQAVHDEGLSNALWVVVGDLDIFRIIIVIEPQQNGISGARTERQRLQERSVVAAREITQRRSQEQDMQRQVGPGRRWSRLDGFIATPTRRRIGVRAGRSVSGGLIQLVLLRETCRGATRVSTALSATLVDELEAVVICST